MITLIVARDRNGAIGKSGDIPWEAPEDLAFFSRETRGGALIMGRNTWESLPVKPLKGRLNIVVSRDTSLGEAAFATPQEAIRHAEAAGISRIYGVGGAAIYAALLPLAHRLLITEVDIEVSAPDTFFPEVDLSNWRETQVLPLRADAPRCTVHEYLR